MPLLKEWMTPYTSPKHAKPVYYSKIYTGWLVAQKWHNDFVRLKYSEYYPILEIVSLSESGDNIQ